MANPGPAMTPPIPFTMPLAKSDPTPSPSSSSLTLPKILLKKSRTFFKLSVTPISPKVLASSFKLIVVSLRTADKV